MKVNAQLAEIITGNSASYSKRIQELETINDNSILKIIAEKADDDWIRLEAAIRGKITTVLEELKNHSDERIKLEVAIELNDQSLLTNIVLTSKDVLHSDIARNYIDEEPLLRKIISEGNRDIEKAEAAIRLGDFSLSKKLISEITEEKWQLRLAQAFGDLDEITRLSKVACDVNLREMASEWLLDLNPVGDNDID